jgi:hypothetical protein
MTDKFVCDDSLVDKTAAGTTAACLSCPELSLKFKGREEQLWNKMKKKIQVLKSATAVAIVLFLTLSQLMQVGHDIILQNFNCPFNQPRMGSIFHST